MGNKNGDAYAFNARTGALSWSARASAATSTRGPRSRHRPGLGPTVFIGSYGARPLRAERRDGGTESGRLGVGSAISGSATVVNNQVYVSTVYGKGSYGFNARTGRQVFYFPDGSYTTAVADRNALFLMGKYIALQVRPAQREVAEDQGPLHRKHTRSTATAELGQAPVRDASGGFRIAPTTSSTRSNPSPS